MSHVYPVRGPSVRHSRANLKVTFLIRSLQVGGAERQLVTLAKSLASRNHVVRVVSFYPGGAFEHGLEAAGVSLHHLAKRSRWDIISPFLRLVQILRQSQPDILHGYLGSANVAAAVARCFLPGSKLVFGIRASEVDFSRYERLSRILSRLEAWLSPLAHLVIANASSVLSSTQARGFASSGLVIPNGIDLGVFKPDCTARELWRCRLGVDDTTFVIGMLARRDPLKDHEGFLRAARIVVAQRPNVAFVLAGSGVDRSDPVLARLAEHVGAPVHLLGLCSEPHALMAAWDLAVLASFSEGFPNAVAEAMACGVPCVVTDVGDSADVVGNLGWIAPPGDSESLARACLSAIDSFHPDLRACVRKRIETNFSLERLTSRTIEVFESLTKPLIVHVITTLDVGGAERMLVRLVTSQSQFRHVVASLMGEGMLGQDLRAAGVKVVDLGMKRGIPSPTGFWRLCRLLLNERPVLVQSWMYHADLLATAAGLLTGRRFSWNVRCSDLDLSRYRRLTWIVIRFLSLLSRFPAVVIVNSVAGRKAHELLGYRPQRWEFIPNGIDAGVFRPDPIARGRWRSRIRASDETLVVGMLARRDPMKDHEGFLTAARIIAAERANVSFVLAGKGVDQSDRILASLASEVGAPVHLLGFCAEPHALMAAWDVAVLASRFGEGFPNVVGEAMACGLPCVVTDVGDSAAIVGSTGCVVPPKDPIALAAAIDALLDEDTARYERGAAARRRALEQFALPAIVALYEDLFSQIISQADITA
jgi:glycosyltransferase involved in cell wall biosynthesis